VQVVVFQVRLAQLEGQAKMVDRVNLVLLDCQATLDDHQWLAIQSNHHHAKNARRVSPDHPAILDHQVTRDLKDQQAKMVAVPAKDQQDQLEPQAKTEHLAQTEHPVMLADQAVTNQLFLVMPDQPVRLDLLETKDHPDHLDPTDKQANPDLKDHPAQQDHQDPTAQMVRPAPTEPQAQQEKRVSVRNTALWTAASSSKEAHRQQDLRPEPAKTDKHNAGDNITIKIHAERNWYSDQNYLPLGPIRNFHNAHISLFLLFIILMSRRGRCTSCMKIY